MRRRTSEPLWLGLLWAACFCVSCASAPTSMQASVAPGMWGADHVNLNVDALGARIEYDCAHGTLNGPLSLDATNQFDVRGTYVREQGGPVPEEEPRGTPARYVGRVERDSLTLSVTLTDSKETLGTFTLRRNVIGVLRKCR